MEKTSGEDKELSNASNDSGWRRARGVVRLVKASKRFKTLRDMIPNNGVIDSSRLVVQSPLGEGAFGYVNLAMLDGARLVAVKTLKPELLTDPTEVELFIKECELMRKIRCLSIVEMIGVGGRLEPETGVCKDLFIIQEYCSGGALREVVFKQMTMVGHTLYTEADALRWSLEIARALQYLHTAKPKVIHRDLKLDNVLLTDKKTSRASAKLADFGLAKLMVGSTHGQRVQQEIGRLASNSEEQWTSVQRQRSVSVNSTLDRMETAMSASPESTLSLSLSNQMTTIDMTCEAGSYSYMAPEVLTGGNYNEKADIFSFAMVMYNTFYRVIPSVLLMAHGGEAEDIAMLAYRTSHGYRPNLSTSVPQAVNDVITACWSGVPEMRPTAEEVVLMLEAIQDSKVCKGSGDIPESDNQASKGCACALM